MNSGPCRPLRACAAVGRTGAAGAADWAMAVKSCLGQLGPIPSSGLGFLYIGTALAPHAGSIATLVRRLTGIDEWIGAASDAVMAVGPGGPEVTEDGTGDGPGLAIMILALPADAYRLMRLPPGDLQGTLDPRLLDWLRSAGKPGAMLHADLPNGAVVAAAASLRTAFGAAFDPTEQLPLVGATLAGEAGRGAARPQICGVVAEGGATGVLFSDAVRGISGLAQGCVPIGPVRRVSDADGGLLRGLDGDSARAAFHRDIGDLLARDPQRTQGFVFAGLIRASERPAPDPSPDGPVVEPDDYAIVPIVDPGGCDDGIRLTAPPAPGDSIVFVRRDQTAAIAALDRMVDRLIRRAGRANIRAAHLITCGDRATSIFGDRGIDLMRIADRLGPVPMIGFQAATPIMGETLYTRAAVLTLWTDKS